jgi:hypothetical protein
MGGARVLSRDKVDGHRCVTKWDLHQSWISYKKPLFSAKTGLGPISLALPHHIKLQRAINISISLWSRKTETKLSWHPAILVLVGGGMNELTVRQAAASVCVRLSQSVWIAGACCRFLVSRAPSPRKCRLAGALQTLREEGEPLWWPRSLLTLWAAMEGVEAFIQQILLRMERIR